MAGMFDDLIPQAPQNPHGNAISGIESGGRYDALGPVIPKTGDRAYGKYQVMGANIGPWSKEALGRELTPQEFVASPEAQEAVFNAKFGSYVSKYGPEGAARAWFAGEKGMNNPNARDVLGTSVADYSRKFQNASGPTDTSSQGRGTVTVKPYQQTAPSISFDDLIPQQSNVPLPQARPQEASPATFNERFGGMDVTPAMSLAVDNQNQQIAGGQGTTPIMDLQRKNLLSDQVYENDAGFTVFRDPQTGQLVEADKAKHVVLRDPQDNRLKVFNRSDETNENPAVSVSRVLAPGLVAGAPTSRAMIPAANAVKPKQIAAPTREALYEAADQGYTQARNLGVKYNSAAVGDMAFNTQRALIEDGFNEITSPNTYKLLGKFGNKADEAGQGSAATFNDLESVRKGLGRVAQGHSSPDAIVRSDASAAARAIEHLDEFFANPSGAVAGDAGQLSKIAEDARGNFAAAKRSERVGRAEDLAELQAASGGSGANIDNAMRQRIKDILKSPKELKGFSQDEIVQMRKIVVGTPAGNTARLLGKLAPTGVVSATMSGGSGFAFLGPAGAVGVPVVGFAAKKMADIMTGSQLAKLDELIRSRSPLAKQMEASLSDWSQKANALSDVPTAPKVAQFALASRNLVNNLKDAGITISPAEFMKVLQGPKPGAAENE